MTSVFPILLLGVALAAPCVVRAAEPPPDPAPCDAAIASGDDDRIIAVCGALIGHDATLRADKARALIARAGAYARKERTDDAIADDDAALRIDPANAAVLNARGELLRKKGDRPRAIRDFSAAMKIDPALEAARANYKSLAREIERLGATMPVPPQPMAPLK